jgi:hypothetical protein
MIRPDAAGTMIRFAGTVRTEGALVVNGHHPDPADVARLSPLGHSTINFNGRYHRPPAAHLPALRTLRAPP